MVSGTDANDKAYLHSAILHKDGEVTDLQGLVKKLGLIPNVNAFVMMDSCRNVVELRGGDLPKYKQEPIRG